MTSTRWDPVSDEYDEAMPYPPGHPDDGGKFAQDADLTVYWPFVRPCWQE